MSSAAKNTSKLIPMPWKILVVLLAAGFLLLGLIGLFLPLLPGLVFVALAVWLLSRISTRVAAYVDDNPALRRQMGFLRRTEGLSFSQRLRLLGWVTAKALVNGINGVLERVKK